MPKLSLNKKNISRNIYPIAGEIKGFIKGISPKVNAIIFTNPSAWVGYDTRSIFKRSLTGLN